MSYTPQQRVHPFDPAMLQTPHGFERTLADCRRGGFVWYVETHAHTCRQCGHVIRHTGLEATRVGDLLAHQCVCGQDIRA